MDLSGWLLGGARFVHLKKVLTEEEMEDVIDPVSELGMLPRVGFG